MGKLLGLDYMQRIWQMRYFWMCLVKNDLENRYRRSFLGIGWSLVKPLCMTAVFCTVFCKLFDQDPRTYAPFLLLSLTLWQYLTECMLGGCNCFKAGASYIRQQSMPLAIFPLRTVIGTGVHQLIALALALGLTWFFNGMADPWTLASLPMALALYFLLGFFLATICGILHTHFPDSQYLLEIILQILFYLTPIIYSLETLKDRQRGYLAQMLALNPFTAVLDIVRDPVLKGQWPGSGAMLISIAFVAIAGLLAAAGLKKFERTLVFWI